MPRTNITEFSNVASENTDINSVNIAENCPASGINNALRELMKALKDVDTGSQALTALSVTGATTITGALSAKGGAVFNEDSADVDFRVEGNGDTHALFVQGGSDHVGINNNSPNSSFTGADNLVIGGGSGHTGMTILSGTSSRSSIEFSDGTGSDATKTAGGIRYYHDSDYMRFNTGGGTERIRVNDKGLLINTTSTLHSGVERALEVQNHSGSGFVAIFKGNNAGHETVAIHNSATSGTRILLAFKTSGSTGTLVGRITSDGSTTNYATSSDYRLKENVEDMTGAIDRVKQLLPKRFNFINDDTNTLVDGFLAHEAQSVVAEAVTGTHNEVDDDGNAVMQGIDQAKLVPLLTGALKEAITKIETLETANTALEARITALENA